jgi:alkylation response protein AidB-like acyl-CoA dehydrogenase
MDLGLNEQQEMLRKMARDFLTTECPKKLVRDMEEDEKGYSPELWRKMAELGWLGLPFAEQYGGMASGFFDLCVLLEEMGRACLPSPFFPTVILSGLAIADTGDDAQKQDFLTAIANGERIVAFAMDEASGGYDAASIAVEAHHHGDHYTVKGTKLFVQHANVADWILCVARTRKSQKPEDGITLLLVKNEKPGVTCTVMPTLAKDKQCEVVFNDARATALGQPDHGWPEVAKLVQRAAAAKSVEMVGGAQQVLEMSVAYAKERVQFDKPIASFQAIQHHCANMALNVDTARLLAYQAACKITDGEPCDTEAAMCKAWASDAYQRVVMLGHQVHGAIGFTLDHDMQLYSRRAKAAEVALGDADYQRELLAQQLEK